jgi:hypothetical protein
LIQNPIGQVLSLASLSVPSIGVLGSAIVAFLILFIIYLLVIGFVLWLAGEIVVGRRVTFGEALGIAGVGTFLIGALLSLLGLVIGGLLGLLVFLLLVKHYFKTGWLGAIGVGIMTIIVGVVVLFILEALALGAIVVLPKIPGL